MHNSYKLLLVSLLCFFFLPFVRAEKETLEIKSVMQLPTEHAKEGFFLTTSNGALWTGGGRSLQSDSTYQYSSSIFVNLMSATDSTWRSVGQISIAVDRPLVVSAPKGVILVGGTLATGQSSQQAILLEVQNGKLKETSLPSLPESLSRINGGVINGQLIAIGNAGDQMRVYKLNVNSPTEWIQLPAPQSGALSTSIAIVQNSGEEDRLYLFDKLVHSYSLKTNQWYSSSEEPNNRLEITENLAAVISGTHHILFFGNDNVYTAYHTVTGRFSEETGQPVIKSPYLLAVREGGSTYFLSDQMTHVQVVSHGSFGWINYSVLIVYLMIMIGVGFYFNKRSKTSDGFFKGGGKIPWWAAGISIFAATLSAITFMAIPAKSYTANWLYFPMSFSILIIAPVIIRWYLPFFRGLKLTSAYEYLERRFNVSVRLISSAFFVIFMITRIAIVLYLPAVALSTVTGMDIILCICLMAVVTVTYATLGGVEAVVWGDVIQGVILVGGAITSLIYIVINAGGLGETIRIAEEAHKFRVLDFALDFTQPTFWVIFFGAGLANSLITYSSDQTIVQKYLTTADEKKAAKSLWLNGLLALPVLLIFYFIGTALYSYYFSKPSLLPINMLNAEGIFPFFIVNELPVGVAGLLIAAIFAATISTLSSNINSASTAITFDFVRKLRPSITDGGMVKSAQISGLVACILGTGLAVILSTMSIKSFFDEFNTFIGLLTSGLGGLFAIGIFMPRVRGYAALSGLIGSIAVLLWLRTHSPVNFMLYGLIGILLSMLIALIVSYIFPEKKKDLTGLCWRDRKTAKEKQ